MFFGLSSPKKSIFSEKSKKNDKYVSAFSGYATKGAENEKGFFFKNYDIKDLPEGDYRFILWNGSEKLVKKFEINSNSSRVISVQ